MKTQKTLSEERGVRVSHTMPGRIMDKEKLDGIWQTYKRTGQKQSRDLLIKNYLHIVRYVAEKLRTHLPESVDVDDLAAAGIFGLMNAIDLFDLKRGIKFETYCVNRIRGAMLDELRAMDWVPRLVRAKSHRLTRAYSQLETKLGRSPTDFDMAKHLNLSYEDYNELAQEACASNILSFHSAGLTTDDDQDMEPVDIINDEAGENRHRLMLNREVIHYIKTQLSQKERLVLELYFYDDLTLKEIGLVLDVSESRANQILTRLLTRLQSVFKKYKAEWLT
ncbi:MAG: FliA/WhiG family RNA polymerase sigma factor [Planctomycetes bacterium]|nr:FliA/WhiG family RNA polymerase sigma factor [Planctomycetota bacterium]